MPKYSIIIPTYNHFEDCLKPAVESILKYTTLNDLSTELIIVANGCTDGTQEYIQSLQSQFHGIVLLWFDEPIGFTKATNEGIKESRGDYIVTFNNDNQLLDQQYNDWLNLLVAPFEEEGRKVGITGPMKEHCPHADRDFILFFLSMISREAIEKVGLLDEIFSPGYGEDTDFCARLADAGYEVVQVPDESRMFYDHNRRTGVFPIYHAGNKTFANWPGGEELLAKNNGILKERYANKQTGHTGFNDCHTGEGTQGYIDVIDIERAKACDGYMSEDELFWLASQASNVKIVIEIGSWHGRSSRALADNLPEDGRLYCVDHWDGSAVERDTNHQSARWNDGDHAYMEFSDNLSDHIQSGKVIPIRMSSKNAAAWFKKQGIQADLIFIDAGHTYEEVKEDIGFWYRNVKIGGIISGHDYNYTDGMWAGVTRAVDESLPGVTQIDGGNIWWIQLGNLDLTKGLVGAYGHSGTPLKPNIYDCFPFFNELEVLDIRFAELYDKVDRFVITEATLTHGGKPKPLYFNDNLERYAKYLNKVTHIVVDQYPALDSWSIERHQRNQLLRGLTGCKDNDIIIISDADEIPRAEAISDYKPERGIMAFEQSLFYYKLNCEATEKWDWAKISEYKDVQSKTPCGIRYNQNDKSTKIRNGGWHFSYLKPLDGIIEKIEATAHQEYNIPEIKDRNRIERLVNEGKDLFDRPLEYNFVEIDNTYPKYVIDNIDKFKKQGLIQELEVLV